MLRLLIVEDEAIVRRGIRTLIDYPQLGIDQVLEASNGQEDWEQVQAVCPQIILTDINLPQLDGLTFAKRVKEVHPEVRIIFLTGYDYFDYARSALKLGADDYLLKPISKKEIEAVLIRTVAQLREGEKQARAQELLSRQDHASSQWSQVIQNHLTEPTLSLKSLATELGFSANYLGSLIKRDLGMSFQDYVAQERIHQAKILLLTGNYKIYEVAQLVGIQDVNYFSVRFKQVVGISPKQFQKEGGAR